MCFHASGYRRSLSSKSTWGVPVDLGTYTKRMIRNTAPINNRWTIRVRGKHIISWIAIHYRTSPYIKRAAMMFRYIVSASWVSNAHFREREMDLVALWNATAYFQWCSFSEQSSRRGVVRGTSTNTHKSIRSTCGWAWNHFILPPLDMIDTYRHF